MSVQSSDPNMRFGEWRGRWLDQGFDDPKITADAFRVAYAKLTSAHGRLV